MPLWQVGFVSSSVLTATIPADLPAGTYTLKVTNPDGQSGTLAGAYTVLSSGDGDLGPWTAGLPLNHPRYWPAVASTADTIYALGGALGKWFSISSPPFLSDVEMARVSSDGRLSPWRDTTPLPVTPLGAAATIVGSQLYLLGGFTDQPSCCSRTATVYRATIRGNGDLSAWEAVASMSVRRSRFASVQANGFIYAIGGDAVEHRNSVERARVDPDGSLSPWVLDSPLPSGPDVPESIVTAAVVSNGRIYAFGSERPPESVRTLSWWTTIQSDGSLAPWQATTPFGSLANNPQQEDFGVAALGGYIYAIGGSGAFSSPGSRRTVRQTPINQDGTLGTWRRLGDMRYERAGLGTAVVNGRIYAIGGGCGPNPGRCAAPWQSDALRSAEYAVINPVTFSTITPTVISPTNPTTLTVVASNLLPGAALRVGSSTQPTMTLATTTTLAGIVPAGLPPGKYDLTVTNGDGRETVQSGALTVPGATPTGTLSLNGGARATTSSAVTVAISGTALLTSAASLRFSADGSTWADWDWQPIAPTLPYTLPGATGQNVVYTQLRGPLGNVWGPITSSIRLDPSPGTSLTMTVAGGGAWTRSAGVPLVIGAPPSTADVQISGQSDFADATWLPFDTRFDWPLPVTGTVIQTPTLYARLRSVTGTVSAVVSDTIGYDPVPPTATISASIPVSGVLRVAQTSSDGPGSGIAAMRIGPADTFSPSAWEQPADAKLLVGAYDGTTPVYAQLRDTIGNVSPLLCVRADGAACPQYDVTPAGNSIWTRSLNASLVLTAPAGTTEVQFSQSGDLAAATWQPYTTPFTVTLNPGTTPGQPFVAYVRMRSGPSNVGPAIAFSFGYDPTPPRAGLRIVPLAGGALQAQLVGYDSGGSGVALMRLTADDRLVGAPWESFAPTKILTGTTLGPATAVLAQVQDAAGNTSDPACAQGDALVHVQGEAFSQGVLSLLRGIPVELPGLLSNAVLPEGSPVTDAMYGPRWAPAE